MGKVTDAMVAFCEAQLVGTVAEGQVGDGKAPDGFGGGYLVVYRIASGFEDHGSMAEPGDMRYVKYQLSAIGDTRAQAEYILDAVVDPFITLGTNGPANPLTIVDHTVVEQSSATDIGLGAEGEYTSMQHVKVLVARNQ